MHAVEVSVRLRDRLILPAVEIAKSLAISLEDVQESFEEVAAANDTLEVLYLVSHIRSDNSCTTTLAVGHNEAQRLVEATAGEMSQSAATVYALRRHNVPPLCSTSAGFAALKPLADVSLRAYPLTSRAALEQSSRAPPVSVCIATMSAALPNLVKKEVARQEVILSEAVKQEVPKVKLVKLEPVPEKAESAEPAAEVLPEKMVEVKHAAPAATPEPPITMAVAATGTAAPAVRRQASLFDMMKSSPAATIPAAPKRAAPEGQQADEPALKKTRKPRAKKAALPPSGGTTSLAKLAKASAKSSGGTKHVVAATHLLDEEDSNSRSRTPRAEDDESGYPLDTLQAYEPEDYEASTLDVTYSSVNDDIVLCDDAAPLVFIADTSAVEPVASQPLPQARKETTLSTPNGSQQRLGVFFAPEVVAFQKDYVREEYTETKLVDGEYICSDAVRYRSVHTSDVLSEKEYHERTSELMAQARASTADSERRAATPSIDEQDLDSHSALSPTPAAATRRASRPAVIKQQPSLSKTSATSAPARNILSFFKK